MLLDRERDRPIRSAERGALAWFRDWDDNGRLPNRRNPTKCDGVVEECSEVLNSSGSKMFYVEDARVLLQILIPLVTWSVVNVTAEVNDFRLISLYTNRVSREKVSTQL